ncbi:MFS transporter [Vibrio inusitatus NBRC 102082]|uniref:MFS transporter n=1 Tax=Vibrio inusitatus NBRC 102082 TaxID=1219070 RepID=A0A4Y3HWC6_9VIBR|nr:MFS transporter [Vibrio inusitatus]GEA51020.1 MFS transporter [Vibrio inusitatus NBRC 102082]
MIKAFNQKQGLVLYVLCIAQFTLSADIANLSISTSILVDVLQTDVASIQVLGSVQPLVGAALMLSASMLGLKLGWRKLLITGSALGFISTFAFLLFDSINTITLFIRPLTGLASALILPSVLALVVAHCQGKSRAIGFGLIAASTGLAAAIMPLLSGWLYDNVAWQWPFVIIALCYGVTLLGALFQVKPLDTQVDVRFDYLGSMLVAISIVLLFVGILKMPTWGVLLAHDNYDYLPWFQFVLPLSPALLCTALGACLLALFIYQQRHFEKVNGRSILPINWFNNKSCRHGFMILALMYLALGGSSFVIVTYLQVALSLSGAHSGMVILIFSVFMIALSILTPLLFKSLLPPQICQLAFIVISLSASLLLMASDSRQIGYLFYIGMVLLGSAMGMLASQCPVIITGALGEREAEQSGGLQATLRNVGMVLGLTLFGGINQHLMEMEVRRTLPSNMATELQIEQTATIPYLSNQQVDAISQHFSLSEGESNQLKVVKSSAREKGFNGVMYLLLFIGLVGFELSRRLGRESIEVRNIIPR